MRNLFLTAAIAASFAFILNISSCADPCKGVVCQNGGTCINGTCKCATGYSGTDCQTAANAQFVGTYNGTDNCVVTTAYPVKIVAQSNPLNITITTDAGDVINATVSGNSITIPSQTLTDVNTQDNVTFSGSGTLTGNSITVTVNIVDNTTPANSETCTFTGSK